MVKGRVDVYLERQWFHDGFAGAMGELLCAIEEGRAPENSARANLRSLQLCFAAIASARQGVAEQLREMYLPRRLLVTSRF